MIKKIVALAATALFSMNASAGYIQYNFSGPITGYVIQHDDDQSVAYFQVNMPISGTPSQSPSGFNERFTPQFGDGSNTFYATTTHFLGDGPANYVGHDNFGGDHDVRVQFDISRNAQGGFSYVANYTASIFYIPQSFYGTGTLTGFVSRSSVDSNLVRILDSMGGYWDGVQKVVPTYVASSEVPEPASIALLAIGALGAAGAARRRKSAR